MPRRFVPVLVLLALASAPIAASAAPFIETHIGVSDAGLHGFQPASSRVQRMALSVGVVQPLGRLFAADIEFGFAGRGADVGDTDIWTTGGEYVGKQDVRYDLDYLQIPVLLHVTPLPGRLRPVFLGGASVSWKTGERYRVNKLELNLEPMARASARHADWGVVAGAGLELDTRPGTWTLEGRYTWGKTDLEPTTFGSGPAQNRDMQWVLGLRQQWPWGR